jgi:hypothetical protein
MESLVQTKTRIGDPIDRDGFAILLGVFHPNQIHGTIAELETALAGQDETAGSIRSSRELIYAARNLLRVWPAALELAWTPAIRRAVTEILGPRAGLVRGLFFDKPPGRSWSLPWHKDMTIAVRDNRLPSQQFRKPTTKAGVPHVEAPEWLLQEMLTARIHLDDVTEDNGPLVVVPASHHTGKEPLDVAANDPRIRSILVSAGDVLLMRPLVAHSSGNSREGTRRHRRIVHLEFASARPLPDGYDWHDFRELTEDSVP